MMLRLPDKASRRQLVVAGLVAIASSLLVNFVLEPRGWWPSISWPAWVRTPALVAGLALALYAAIRAPGDADIGPSIVRALGMISAVVLGGLLIYDLGGAIALWMAAS